MNDNPNPKVTVIMPTYNRATFLNKSVGSIMKQTYKDFELIIIDDGSTDNTKEVLQPFLSDKRIRYVYHDNQGDAESVNLAWSMARGEYFTQVNSDDYITPNSFEVMVRYMDANPKAVVGYPDYTEIDDVDNVIQTIVSPDWNYGEALRWFACYATAAGTFIRVRPFISWTIIKDSRLKYINDLDMYWKMAIYGNFIHVPQVLASWRIHSSQISSSRYKSVDELEKWYNSYFSRKDLPYIAKKVKKSTKICLINSCIHLIENSELSQEEKDEKINSYKAELKKTKLFYFPKIRKINRWIYKRYINIKNSN